MEDEEVLLEAHPSWGNYLLHFIFFWLILPLIIAWLARRSELMRITENRVSVEWGILHKVKKEIFINDMRAIEVTQGITHRLFGIGDIKIATAGTNDYELVLWGYPIPNEIKAFILDQSQEVRRTSS